MPVKLDTWQDKSITNLAGGLILDSDSELLEDNEVVHAQNAVIRNRILTSDTGYIQFLNAVRGNPRRSFTYKTFAGVEHQILVTDLTVYRNMNEQWQYVSNGTSTLVNGTEAAGQTAISVDSEVGFANGSHIGIVLDTGQMHMTTVVSTSAGVINITDALPSQAADNSVVVSAVVLTGTAFKHVTGILLPWNGWLVFTNGVDNVKRYDPAAGSVIDLPGLTATVCETLALYDNSIVIGNTTESSSRFPFRIKYCAKGDATAWTTLEAGTTDFLETTSDILQLLRLGPYLIAYRSDSILRIAISGSGVKRFDSQTTVADTGVFSNIAAIGLRDRHIVWGNENFFVYKAGYSIEEIFNPLKEDIYGVAGKLKLQQRRSECFAFLLKPVNEIIFAYGTTATTQQAAERFHIDYGKFTRRNFAMRLCGFGDHLSVLQPGWDDLSGSFDAQEGSWLSLESLGESYGVILGNADNDSTYLYNFSSSTDDATPITVVVVTKDFAHPTYLLLHDYLEVGYRAGDAVTVEYSLDKGNTYELLGTLPASGITSNVRLFKQFTSRKIRFRFTCISRLTLAYLNMRFMYVSEW